MTEGFQLFSLLVDEVIGQCRDRECQVAVLIC